MIDHPLGKNVKHVCFNYLQSELFHQMLIFRFDESVDTAEVTVE